MRIGSAVALVTAMTFAGCGQPDYVTDSRASVLLIVENVNEGSVLDSDVRLGLNSSFVCADSVPVALSVRPKNPMADEQEVDDVRVTRYEVSYHRSDGRDQQGVDVPYTVTGAISTMVANGGDTELFIEVVRIQAKLEPPLANLVGSNNITMFAQITISGETLSGEGVSGSGSLQIDFADYGDDEEECPEQG